MLTHKGTQDIRTKRLLLRQYKISDSSLMFKNYAFIPRSKYAPHYGKT